MPIVLTIGRGDNHIWPGRDPRKIPIKSETSASWVGFTLPAVRGWQEELFLQNVPSVSDRLTSCLLKKVQGVQEPNELIRKELLYSMRRPGPPSKRCSCFYDLHPRSIHRLLACGQLYDLRPPVASLRDMKWADDDEDDYTAQSVPSNTYRRAPKWIFIQQHYRHHKKPARLWPTAPNIDALMKCFQIGFLLERFADRFSAHRK